MSDHDIPSYLSFLPEPLLQRLWSEAEPFPGVTDLRVGPGLREEFPHIETAEALSFVCALYEDVREQLRDVLEQRVVDRAFIDASVAGVVESNANLAYHAPEYATPIGKRDPAGRVVVGPAASRPEQWPRVEIPDYMAGDQVTLFGPPDTAKLSINAMNAIHRRPADEPEIIGRLVDDSGQVARWGADNEDSKTPIMRNFLHACENLGGCFDGSLRFVDERRGKVYELAGERLSRPIKRFPGIALPDGNHLLRGEPLPLHLVDFGLHLFHNHRIPEALAFYVPKLENEEEAAYLKALIAAGERRIKQLSPDYALGTVRVLVVFENPRAIFRIREIATALHPHFLGGSLGWHDFLASTARLFKNDPRYRIPVKADPNIVINHIRESHEILVRELEPLGAIKIGGMYGVLYEEGNAASHEVSMVGYVKDVVTQLKRGLDGFWVAHPDFVRPGIALVRAYREGPDTLRELVEVLVPNPVERAPLLKFVFGTDVAGLREDDPRYERGVLAADIEISDVVANHDPAEVRYNVFQALQYLADWLSGNGCVALPATMTNARGEPVFVRIMDDLATTERSRWELWAELHHGRVSAADFEAILEEELSFIREGRATPSKRVAIAWEGEAARWYPVAARLLRAMVLAEEPPEFATEYLLPFTFSVVRDGEDPWGFARSFDRRLKIGDSPTD